MDPPDEALIHEARRRTRRRRIRYALVALAAVTVGAAALWTLGGRGDGAATAGLGQTPAVASREKQRGGTLTIIGDAGRGQNPMAAISAVGAPGVLRTIWSCPRNVFCGDLTSISWSPEGRRVAFTLDQLGGRSGYVGLHVLDTATGHDLHIPRPAVVDEIAAQPDSVLRDMVKREAAQLGCWLPDGFSWSPDGRQLIYSCPDSEPATTRRLFRINVDGTHRRLVPTGVVMAFWPAWSPDGKRIAYATGLKPITNVQTDTELPAEIVHSRIYVAELDGSHRELIATNATAPAWSPDGTELAIQLNCGIRILELDGRRIGTPGSGFACDRAARPGPPTWSPNGTKLAYATHLGIYEIDPDGTKPEHLTNQPGTGIFGNGRPAWRPRRTGPSRD